MNQQELSDFVARVGIVDRVAAYRIRDEVTYLAVTVRFETPFKGSSYSDEKKVDNVEIAMPPDSGVNPGDVVSLSLGFKSPFGQRFNLALEATNGEEDDDVLEVMVEDGMKEGV